MKLFPLSLSVLLLLQPVHRVCEARIDIESLAHARLGVS